MKGGGVRGSERSVGIMKGLERDRGCQGVAPRGG